MSNFDTELFVTPPDLSLICSICHEVPRHPITPGCGHLFCIECMKELLSRGSTCPVDRGALELKSLDINGYVANLISGLKYNCPYKENGCTEPPFFLGKEGARLDEHLSRCDWSLVKCVECDTTMKRNEVAEHMMGQEKCPHITIRCAECDGLLKRMEMKEHMEGHDECPHKLVACDICDELHKRREQEEHDEKAARKHVRILAQKLAVLERWRADVEEDRKAGCLHRRQSSPSNLHDPEHWTHPGEPEDTGKVWSDNWTQVVRWTCCGLTDRDVGCTYCGPPVSSSSSSGTTTYLVRTTSMDRMGGSNPASPHLAPSAHAPSSSPRLQASAGPQDSPLRHEREVYVVTSSPHVSMLSGSPNVPYQALSSSSSGNSGTPNEPRQGSLLRDRSFSEPMTYLSTMF